MLQVRSYKLLLCAVLLLAAGCKKEEPNQPDQPVTPTEQTETIAGNVSNPGWAVPEPYDLSSSMTVIAKVDLALTYTEAELAGWSLNAGDMLAAFNGEQCLGVATPQDGLFYLYITPPENEGQVALKYYSAAVSNIFVTDPIPYVNDEKLGTVAEPYTPKWQKN